MLRDRILALSGLQLVPRLCRRAGFRRQIARSTIRSLKTRPIDLIDADKIAMLGLPPIAPRVGFHGRVRLARDYYVRVTFEGLIVADHVRSWGNALTITDPSHVETAGRHRHTFQNPIRSTGDSDLLRDLADCDAAFGVDLDGQVAS